MNMINSLPNIRIRNNFDTSYPRQFFEVAERLLDIKLLSVGNDLFSPFSYYDYPKNHILCTSQTFIKELNPPKENDDSNAIIGFKEVCLNVSLRCKMK